MEYLEKKNVVDFEVPVVTLKEIHPSVQKTINLEEFISCLSEFNLNPPYARGFVWEQEQQDNLILSMISNITFNNIVVVKDDNVSNIKNVIDGKQRISTLKRFLGNEFGVKCQIDDEVVDLYWNDIVGGKYPILKHNVLNYPLYVVEYDPMPLDEQVKLYMQINPGTIYPGKKSRII